MTAPTAELQDFAARYTAAWCSHNAASVGEFYAPGGSLCINKGVPAVGRSAITKSVQEFVTAFPDLHVYMDAVIVQTATYEYRWTLTGTNTGPGGTGGAVRISGFETWTLNAARLIAESQGTFDDAEYQRQLHAR
jgi:chloramphenicol 3-O-phosphotransferase